jgi:hypothetical protein
LVIGAGVFVAMLESLDVGATKLSGQRLSFICHCALDAGDW